MSPDFGSPVGHRELIRRMQAQRAAEEKARNEAARANDATRESHAPRVRLRASRHELTGQFFALSEEDRVAFTRHCDGILSELAPQGHRENWLAVSIAEDQWRLNRARALENNIFAIGMSTDMTDGATADSPEVHAAICQARVWLRDARHLQLLSLYEQRIRRSIEKNERQLEELQTARRAAQEEARGEAILLAQLAIEENREWDAVADAAEANGCGIPRAEILRLAHRELRLRKAMRLLRRTHGHRRREPRPV